MSVNSALQQSSSAFATYVAGLIIHRDATGRLAGYPQAGYVAAAAFALTVGLAAWLRAAAPHAARNFPVAGPAGG
jgi:hypothetical protein